MEKKIKNKNKFGKWIKKKRIEKDLTQEYVAENIDWNQSCLSQFENGNYAKFDIHVFGRLIMLLNIRYIPREVFTEEDYI